MELLLQNNIYAYRLNTAGHKILRKAEIWDIKNATMISENAEGHWHGTSREHPISGISHPFQHRECLPGGIIPASVSEWLRLPKVRLYGILPCSQPEHVPVPCLSTPDLCHGRDGHASHTSAVDGLVLGDLSLCHGQTRHFHRPAEPHTEHLL